MVEWIEESAGNVAGIKLGGKITAEDYQEIIPRLEEILDEYGAVRLVAVLHDIRDMELGALWEDLKFDAQHARSVTRFALVGDAAWEKWLVRLSKPFIGGECKFFRRDDEVEAWRWIHGDD